VAIDYSPQDAFSVELLSPVKATDELGRNVLSRLEKEDRLYLEQPDIGNTVTLQYKSSSVRDEGKEETYILKTKGYYEHIRDFKNKPDVAFLRQFTKPNAFPLYGMQLYHNIREQQLRSLVKTK
jgi:hypothetical protein